MSIRLAVLSVSVLGPFGLGFWFSGQKSDRSWACWLFRLLLWIGAPAALLVALGEVGAHSCTEEPPNQSIVDFEVLGALSLAALSLEFLGRIWFGKAWAGLALGIVFFLIAATALIYLFGFPQMGACLHPPARFLAPQ